MATYNIAICEDEEAQAAYLKNLVTEWAGSRNLPTHILHFPNGESFLFRYEEDPSFDILLLDIEMGQVSGVELAKRIRTRNRQIQIVFVTGYTEYLAQGYDVEALHYLLKPVSPEKLSAVLDRAVERTATVGRSLILQQNHRTLRIPLAEIRYLEAQKNYTLIHAQETYSVKMPLCELERELDESFFKTGRSYLVNLRYVKYAERTEVCLKDGTLVPLSRGLYRQINQAIIAYFR